MIASNELSEIVGLFQTAVYLFCEEYLTDDVEKIIAEIENLDFCYLANVCFMILNTLTITSH